MMHLRDRILPTSCKGGYPSFAGVRAHRRVLSTAGDFKEGEHACKKRGCRWNHLKGVGAHGHVIVPPLHCCGGVGVASTTHAARRV
eukprot:scaffold38486_cov75-Phaeocystis_antarctica.AAC.3